MLEKSIPELLIGNCQQCLRVAQLGYNLPEEVYGHFSAATPVQDTALSNSAGNILNSQFLNPITSLPASPLPPRRHRRCGHAAVAYGPRSLLFSSSPDTRSI